MITPATIASLVKVLIIGSLSFLIAFICAPLLIKFLYAKKMWRKSVRDKAIDGASVSNFQKFHSEGETSTPRMAGLLFWLPPLILAVLFYFLGTSDIPMLAKLNFWDRSQTWLPFFALIVASLVGLADDLMQIYGHGKYIAGGLSLRYRLLVIGLMGFIGGWWMSHNLGWQFIDIPFVGNFDLGWQTINLPWMGNVGFSLIYILFFIVVMMATYSGGVIDGIDGLAGGSFLSMFAAFGVIAFVNNQINLACFCFAIFGALLAFLWFNIPPAKFYMGETGSMGLCAAIAVVAFLTNSVMVLPIIGILLVLESGSVIIQLLSKKFRGKKVFLAAPIHLHLEAIGWPPYSVTMRFWIIGILAAFLGVIIRIIG